MTPRWPALLAACAPLPWSAGAGPVQLVVPEALRCAARGDSDIVAGIERLVQWALSARDDDAVAKECALGALEAISRGGAAQDDSLLLQLATSPALMMIADLGKIAHRSTDLALDPWLRTHCRSARSPSCSGDSFDDIVRADRFRWASLGASLYENLRPSSPLSPRGGFLASLGTPAVSVVGSHSGLSIAIAEAFSSAMREGGVNVSVGYFGHWAWCQNVGNCGEQLAELFRHYQQDWAETSAETNAANFAVLVSSFREVLARREPRELFAADMLLCTRPFLFCWLLRKLWPDGSAQLPMLHYYSGPLLFDTPAGEKLEVLKAFRATVLESPLDLVVSSSALQSAWMLAMAGVVVPHVRPHAAQLRGLYTAPSQRPSSLSVLFLRSTWINAMAGEAFRSVLAMLLRASSLEGRLSAEWLLSGKFLQYEEIARFDAAVFLPEQPDKLTFWEQYEMNMPLWLPSVDLWTRIHALGEYRYSVFAHLWEAELPEGKGAMEACGVPAPLFFQGDSLDELHLDSPLAPALWYHLTDYAIFPHLYSFRSAADLISQLLDADLAAASHSMAEFNARTWEASAAFYREAFVAMSGAADSQRPLTPTFAPQPQSVAEWSRICGG